MKNRGISWLLALTFLLSVFMFCTTAFAATSTQDGLTAELITDKTAYASGEEVDARLKIANNGNAKVNNIRTELILPEGLSLKRGTLVSPSFDLDAGTDKDVDYLLDIEATTAPTTTVSVTTAPVTTAPATTVPATTVAGTTAVGTTVAGTTVAPTGTPGGPSDTGDISLYIFCALAVFSLIGLVVVMGGFKGLLKNRWFVLVLCAALLMPVLAPVVSIAAPADKSFTVNAEITVDDAPAVVTAKVTYDVDGDYIIEGENELAYKQAGAILYKLGEAEKGYFLPSDVTYNGSTTSKDGTYRPEVYAPYIEMLFGSYVETTAKAGQIDATKLFNKEAANSVLIGLTKDAATAEALALIEKNQWIITEIDGKLIVTGWYDNATVAAMKYLNDAVNAGDDVTLNLPVIGGLEYSHGNMPILEDATFLNGMDSDQGAVVLRYEGEKTAFQAYADKLEAGGWTLYHENTLYGYKNAENLFATYVQGDDAIHIAYLYNSLPNATEQEVAGFDSAMKKAWEASYRSVDEEIRVILEPKANLFPIDDPAELDLSHVGGVAQPEQLHVLNLFTPYGDGNDVGASMVYTLADGSFFVWDGGIADDANVLYKTLKAFNKRDDGIVIAGWVLTHAHNDHTGAFQAIAQSEWADEITVEKVIVNRMSPTYSWRGVNDPYGGSSFYYGFHEAIGKVETLAAEFKGDAEIVVPHMGQVMEIRNLNIESLTVGDEDVFPVIINNDNAGSHVAKITYDSIDQTVMMFADSCLDQTYNIFFPLMMNELDGDLIQTVHHGLGGNTSRLYPIVNKNVEARLGENAQYVAIWNTTERSLISNNNGPLADAAADGSIYNRFYTDMNKALRPSKGGYAVEDIIADSYVKTLSFPYEPGTYTTTYITGNKSDFFDSEEIKVGYLHATDLAADANTIAELKELNADLLVLTEVDATVAETLAQKLGYTFAYSTEDHLVLSRIPVAKSEKVAGTDAVHVVLDADGLGIDVYAGQFDAAAAGSLISAFAPEGEYWVIVGNMDQIVGSAAELKVALGLTADPVKAGLSGNVYEAYVSAGAVVDDPALTGDYYTFNLKLSRKPLCEDLEIGSFDNDPSVGYWWVNYRNENPVKEQVVRWLLKNKHEVVGLVHVPTDALSDEGAAYLAELAGYEYFSYDISWTKSGVPTVGHMLLSHYPIEEQEPIILREDGQTAEGRLYGHAIVDIPNIGKVDFYYGENDSSGSDLATQRATLEAAVKAVADASGRPFVITGYNEGHVTNSYAGKTVNVYNNGGGVIIASAPLPMTGRESYGTTQYPVGGESPIKISIPNIDPYHKVDLVSIPEYQVTVTNGTGTKLYPAGAEVTIKASAPAKGKAFDKWVIVTGDGVTFTDASAANTTFTMIGGPVEVKATYKDVPIEEKDPTGDTKNLKVAVMPAFRLGGKYANNAQAILDNLMAVTGTDGWKAGGSADVLALPLMDYDKTCGYNTTVDMFATLKTAFADVYPEAYFSRNWLKGTSSDTDPDAGYLGHMFFSKYEIIDTENIILNTENNGQGEVRSMGRVTIKVPGTGNTHTNIDLFFGQMGAASNWTSGESNLYEEIKSSEAEAWMVMGNIQVNSIGKANLESTLNQGVISAFAFNYIDIIGSDNLTFSGAAKDATLTTLLTNPDNIHFVTVTVPIYEAEAKTKYAVNVNGASQGFYAAGDTVTLNAPAAAAGYVFDSWTLPAGVTLTDGTTVNDKTIKFTMQAEILNFTVNFNEVTTAKVTFDANGGFGTMAAETVNVGTYNVPAECDFLSPAGATFKGWSTVKNGAVVNTLDVTHDTTLYAVWEYTGKFTFMNWWVNYANNPVNKEAVVKFVQDQNYDIVTMFVLPSDAVADDAAAAAFAGNFDYPYYRYVTTGTKGSMVLSKYPLGEAEKLILSGATAPNIACHVVATINGNSVDIYAGDYDHVGALDNLATEVIANYEETDNEFIIAGYNNNKISSTDGLKDMGIDAWNGSYGGVSVSSGITMSNETVLQCADYGIPYGAIDNINVATLDMPSKMNVAMVPAFRFANNYAANANAIHEALKALGADVLAVAQIDKNCSSYNNMDVPGSIVEALKEVYPYSYWVDAWEKDGGTAGHLLLSKYEILDVEKIVLNAGTPNDSGNEGRAFMRTMLRVDGATVDVFFGWMSDNYWSTFAPYVIASEADAWVATGHLRYANPEKVGIETALGESISTAFTAWNEGGNTHWCNIISSNNGTISNVKREVCNDRFGANADPLYQADITFDFT